MKETIQYDISYVASVAPITELGIVTPTTGEILDYFIVHPVVKKTVFGKEKLLSFKEVITNQTICTCEEYRDDFNLPTRTYCYYDAISKKHGIGDPYWRINRKATADRLLKKEVLEKYYSQTPEQIIDRIAEARIRCQEFVKKDSLAETFIRNKKGN